MGSTSTATSPTRRSRSPRTQYQSLLEATERALQAAIDVVKRDKRIGEIGRAIDASATKEGFKPINNLSGHTLEQYMVHAGKSIPNLYAPNLPVLKKDDVFAIEPFLTPKDAAGYVIEAPQENIFSIVVRKRTGTREFDDLLNRLWDQRKTLPFTPRWFNEGYSGGRLTKMLKELERRTRWCGLTPPWSRRRGGPWRSSSIRWGSTTEV